MGIASPLTKVKAVIASSFLHFVAPSNESTNRKRERKGSADTEAETSRGEKESLAMTSLTTERAVKVVVSRSV